MLKYPFSGSFIWDCAGVFDIPVGLKFLFNFVFTFGSQSCWPFLFSSVSVYTLHMWKLVADFIVFASVYIFLFNSVNFYGFWIVFWHVNCGGLNNWIPVDKSLWLLLLDNYIPSVFRTSNSSIWLCRICSKMSQSINGSKFEKDHPKPFPFIAV